MPECDNGNKWKALNDRAALVRHAIALIVIIAAVAIAWNDTQHAVKAADRKADANAKAIAEIQGKLNALDQRQQVIINQLDNNRRNADAFQMRTESNLNRILDAVEDLQKRDRDAPR